MRLNTLKRVLFTLGSLCLLIFSCYQRNEPYSSNIPGRIRFIVVLGSSTAEGTGAKPIDSSWVNRLQTQLRDEGKNTLIINLAKGGFTTYDILPYSYTAATDSSRNVEKALSYNPELIIINLPSNDVARGYADEKIIENYNVITKFITERNGNYLITSTHPRDFPNFETRKRLSVLNEKLLTNFPNHVIDYYNKISTPNFFISEQVSFKDGVHLNNKGHDIIFRSIYTDSLFRSIFYP